MKKFFDDGIVFFMYFIFCTYITVIFLRFFPQRRLCQVNHMKASLTPNALPEFVLLMLGFPVVWTAPPVWTHRHTAQQTPLGMRNLESCGCGCGRTPPASQGLVRCPRESRAGIRVSDSLFWAWKQTDYNATPQPPRREGLSGLSEGATHQTGFISMLGQRDLRLTLVLAAVVELVVRSERWPGNEGGKILTSAYH